MQLPNIVPERKPSAGDAILATSGYWGLPEAANEIPRARAIRSRPHKR